jgi:glycosyltransferase involved in cell wall biosynthesis
MGKNKKKGKSRARVGMFIDVCYPTHPRIENEAHALIAVGYEVHLFCICYDQHVAPFEEIDGLKVHRHIGGWLLSKLAPLAYTLPFFHVWMTGYIARFIRDNGIEYLHIHNMLIAPAVLRANRNLHLPVLMDVHEYTPEIMKHYRHVRTFPGKYLIHPKRWKRAYNRLVEKMDCVMVVTDEAKAQLLEDPDIHVPETQIVVFPNTITKQIFLQYQIDASIASKYTGTYNIVYLGDTGLRRGTDTAIEAMPALLREIPNARLVLVGKSSADHLLRARVAELGLESCVVFEGWQDVSLFPSFLSVADVCISPLKRNPHHDTTYANKNFQYMALGKPQVVSDCPAQANLVRKLESGLVHEAENVEDYTEKILALYRDPALAARLGQNGARAVAETYHTEHTIQAMLSAYESLAGNKAVRGS